MKDKLIALIDSNIFAAAGKADKAENKMKEFLWNKEFIFSKFQEYLVEQMFWVPLTLHLSPQHYLQVHLF